MKEFIQLVLPSGLAIAAVAFLAKVLIKHWLDKDVQTFKNRLEATATQETEKLKAQLRLEMSKREFTFTKMHERRAEVVADIFALLVQTHGLVIELASATAERACPGRPKEGLAILEKARPKQLEASATFNENRIFLNDSLCDRLATCMLKYSTLIDMCANRLRSPEITLDSDKQAGNKAIHDMQDSLNELATTLKKDLCEEFRAILGAADNNALNRTR